MHEILHKQITDLERRSYKLKNNQSPNVPQYDLTAPLTGPTNMFCMYAVYYTNNPAGGAIDVSDSVGNTWTLDPLSAILHISDTTGIGPYHSISVGAAFSQVSNAVTEADMTVTIDPTLDLVELIIKLYTPPTGFAPGFFDSGGTGMNSSAFPPDTLLEFLSGDHAYDPGPASFLPATMGDVFTVAAEYGSSGWSPVDGTLVETVHGTNLSMYGSLITGLANGATYEPGGIISNTPCAANFQLLGMTT